MTGTTAAQRSRSDVCLQCGETRGAIRDNRLGCAIGGGSYEYPDDVDLAANHRFAPWKDDELARAGISPHAYDRHRTDRMSDLEWVPCDDLVRGHVYATAEDEKEWDWPVGRCVTCGSPENTAALAEEAPHAS